MRSSEGQLGLNFPKPNNCIAHKKYSKFITKAEAGQANKFCVSKSFGTLTCRTEDADEYLADISGLSLNTVQAKPVSLPQLPAFFPMLHQRVFNCSPSTIPFPMVGVSLTDAQKYLRPLSKGYMYLANTELNYKLMSLPIFSGKAVVLSQTGKDVLIESVWTNSLDERYFQRVSGMNFACITGFNFSIFFGDCSFGHRYNIKKSLEAFRLSQTTTTPTIPHMYWANEFHLQDLAKWLNDNPAVTLISVNCQCYRAEDFALVEYGLRYFAKNVKQKIRFLLEGPPIGLLLRIPDLAGRVHITTKEPVMYALYHRQYSIDGIKLRRIKRPKLSKEYLLGWNTTMYAEYLEKIFFNQPKLSLAPAQQTDKLKVKFYH